jgi:predicted O-methyltransferase YrrM
MTVIDTTGAGPEVDEEATGALASRVFEGGVAAFELIAVELGRQLGLYDVLSEHGPVTPADLAKHADIHPRYAREWLEQQTIAGFLEVDDPSATAEERTYRLPAVTAAVLVDQTSLAYLAPFGTWVAGVGGVLPQIVDAYRSGGGVSFGGYGDLVRDAQAALNRPAFTALLADWVMTSVPEVHTKLSVQGGRIADIGCGCGWSTIALGRAYPNARVDGLDNDEPSIEAARRNATTAGVGNVGFDTRDAADPSLTGQYDLVCIFEALHDMSHPVEVLTAARKLLAPAGSVLVMDERVADTFGAVGDPIERLMYSASAIHCLLVGMADADSAGTGAVMRTSTLEEYADHAGLSVTVLPIEHDCWRFYRLDA